jgi:rhodanese-related sulfurtransferase
MNLRLPLIASVAAVVSACGTVSPAEPSAVSAAEASRLVALDPHPVVLDVRTREEFEGGHLPGARLIPWTDGDFEERAVKELDRGKPVLVYCARGSRSAGASKKLASLGFQVRDLDGGINAWKRGGHPITPSR